MTAAPAAAKWTLVVHGGAGSMAPGKLAPEQEAATRAGIEQALQAGEKILSAGGSALDAVEAAVKVLEDDPHFNAGRGAVFTYEGRNELDAAVMDGRTRGAGAVTGVTRTRHPVSLARAVMEKSPHVFLSREGADQFSRDQGLEQVDPDWFATPERWRQLDELKQKKLGWYDVDLKYGTVGAVAVDGQGHVAAATSTGGLTGKRWGRIGDSPIVGAGTYADDRACAVSATGAGEFFIRVGVAHEICTQLRIAGKGEYVACPPGSGELSHCAQRRILDENLAKSVADGVMDEVADLGGSGGVIFVTPDYAGGWSFNTPGMYRGRVTSTGVREVAIYGDGK